MPTEAPLSQEGLSGLPAARCDPPFRLATARTTLSRGARVSWSPDCCVTARSLGFVSSLFSEPCPSVSVARPQPWEVGGSHQGR